MGHNNSNKELTYSNPVLNNLNQLVYYETKKLSSIVYQKPVSIKNIGITSSINNIINNPQVYYFGPSLTPLWIIVDVLKDILKELKKK